MSVNCVRCFVQCSRWWCGVWRPWSGPLVHDGGPQRSAFFFIWRRQRPVATGQLRASVRRRVVVHQVFVVHDEHCESGLVQLVRQHVVLSEEESLDGQAPVVKSFGWPLLSVQGEVRKWHARRGYGVQHLVTMCNVGEGHLTPCVTSHV